MAVSWPVSRWVHRRGRWWRSWPPPLLGADRSGVKRRKSPPIDVEKDSENPLGGLGNLGFGPASPQQVGGKTLVGNQPPASRGCRRGGALLPCAGRADAERLGVGAGCYSREGRGGARSLVFRGEADRMNAPSRSHSSPSPVEDCRSLALGCGITLSSAAVAAARTGEGDCATSCPRGSATASVGGVAAPLRGWIRGRLRARSIGPRRAVAVVTTTEPQDACLGAPALTGRIDWRARAARKTAVLQGAPSDASQHPSDRQDL